MIADLWLAIWIGLVCFFGIFGVVGGFMITIGIADVVVAKMRKRFGLPEKPPFRFS